MHVERSSVKNEDEGKINWATNGAAMYVVVNKDQPNKFGSSPGYRIMPGGWSSERTKLASVMLEGKTELIIFSMEIV